MVAEIMGEAGLIQRGWIATRTNFVVSVSGSRLPAMILRPKLVVLDEPTSALDMTVQVHRAIAGA
jgi:ABC-type microcin C transport system duplicated ATPase subunit YejF